MPTSRYVAQVIRPALPFAAGVVGLSALPAPVVSEVLLPWLEVPGSVRTALQRLIA